MLKKLFLFLLLATTSLLSQPSGVGWSYPPCTPEGFSFSESMGDGGILCWATGPTKCNHTWTVTGSAANFTIAATPGAPPLYTACNNSAKFTLPSGSNQFLTFGGSFPTITAGNAADFVFTIDVTAQAMASFDLTKLLAPGIDTGGATTPATVFFRFDGTNLQLQADGSTISANVNITLNAWHTVKLHIVSGANASFLQVDGGTQNTFTENANAVNFINLGTSGGNLDALTYFIGNLLVNSTPSPNCVTPVQFVDMNGATAGTTVTVASMGASSHGGNGAWSLTASPATGMSHQTTAIGGTLVPFDICGTYVQNSGGTLSMQYDVSQATHNFPIFTPTTTNVTSWSAGMWFSTNIDNTDTNFYTLAFIVNLAGTDRAGPEMHGTGTQLQLHFETGNSPGATGNINYTSGQVVWITWQYNAGGTHQMKVYDSSGTLLGSITDTSLNSNQPATYQIGRAGSESGTPAGKVWNYSDLIMDYQFGIFPLGPSFTN